MSNFHDAIDLILKNDPCEEWKYPSWTNDNEYLWLKFLPKQAPQVIKDARGIGAWNNPKIIIIVSEIQTPNTFATQSKEYGHPWWNDLARYRRLRPFNESKKSLNFFYSLFKDFNNVHEWCYITPFKKSWCIDQITSNDLFNSEMNELFRNEEPKLILCIGNGPQFTILGREIKKLNWPSFYSKYHNNEWSQWQRQFRDIINDTLKE